MLNETKEETHEEKRTTGGIPLSEAKEMVSNYVKRAVRGSNGKVNETISVWFSLKHLNDIVKTLNEELTTSKPGEETSGLRIYFANYGKNPPANHTNYAHQNTVLLVSTRKVIGQADVHKDYFDGKLMPPENRGALCPPNLGCDCTSDLIDPTDPLC